MIEVTCLRRGFGRQAQAEKVIYKTERHAVGRFPEPGDEELLVRTPADVAKRLRRGDCFLREVMEKGEVLYEAGHA
jgi:hypothetical protein